MTLHVEATGRDPHHVAEAACKAVGRALRDAVRARRRRAPVDEGRAVKVAICALRRGQRPLGRARVRAARRGACVPTTLERCATPTSRCCRASARRGRRWRACGERGLDVALRERAAAGRPILGICLGLQLALDESEEDGGVAGLGLVPGPRGAAARRTRAAHRLGAGRAGRRGVLVRALLRRRDARGDRDERGPRRDRRARLVHRRAVPSREERRGGRALPGAMPLPRLIPCLDVAGGRVVKGVRFQGLRDVGDPVELGAAYSDAGADELVFLDISATVESRAARRSRSPRASPSRSRSRSPSAAASARVDDATRGARGGSGQGERQLGGARAARADRGARTRRSAARRSSSRSTPRTGASARTAATRDAARDTVDVGARVRGSAARASCS